MMRAYKFSPMLRFMALVVSIALATAVRGQQPADGVEDNDADVRTGTVAVADDSDEETFVEEVTIPSFVHTSRNHIKLNGADWSALTRAIADVGADPFTIVHIGDSHIQADYATGLTRRLLQYDFGDAGRGLITPLRMCGTNQPEDYIMTGTGHWRTQKLLKQPWKMPMGFTGVAVAPSGTSTRLTVGTRESEEDFDPFVSLTLFHNGRIKITGVTDPEGGKVEYRTFPSRDYTHVVFDTGHNEVTLDITCARDFALYGVSLSGDRPGVFYHTIGNNGATYSVYGNVRSVGRGISPLQPDLVIISLGTNEAFGKVNRASLYEHIDAMVKDIRQTNPESKILLVTPMECQKSVYRTRTKQVKVPAKKGRKSKTRTVNKQVRERTGSYAPNTAVTTVRDVINRYGIDNGIAVYDWYDVAGGEGASSKWINAGMFGKDHVHHTVKGYHVHGQLLYEALKKALTGHEQ